MGAQRLTAPFELRPFRWADLADILSVWNAACQFDGVPQPAVPAAFEAQWRARPAQEQHTLTAWAGGGIVGYCWALPVAAARALGSGRVLPEYRGQGIGRALIASVDTRLAGVCAPPVRIERVVDARLLRDLRLLHRLGYASAQRRVHMQIAFTPAGIRSPRLPAGIHLRPFSREADAVLLSACLGAQADPDACASASQVACDASGQVVGAAFVRADGVIGQIEHVFIHASYRREGLAGALVLALLRACQQAGMQGAQVWVDDNAQPGARALYAQAGLQAAETLETQVRVLSAAG